MAQVVETDEPTVIRERETNTTNVVRDEPRSSTGLVVALLIIIIVLIALFLWRPWSGTGTSGSGGNSSGSSSTSAPR
jgi:hypothetical protein